MSFIPEVSVVVTVYNGENYIEPCIESILSQTLTNWELNILDDGSIDSTVSRAKKYLEDGRIHLYCLGRVGRTRALNEGIRQSRAPFIAIQDVDDISLPERLKRQVDYLNSHPDGVVVGSAYIYVDEIHNQKHIRINPIEDAAIRRDMSKYTPLVHTSMMFRKSTLMDVGLYDESKKFNEEAELLIQVAPKGKLANLSEPLVVHYCYPNSFFNTHYSTWKKSIDAALMSYRAIKHLNLPKYLYLLVPLRFLSRWVPKLWRNRLRPVVSKRQVTTDALHMNFLHCVTTDPLHLAASERTEAPFRASAKQASSRLEKRRPCFFTELVGSMSNSFESSMLRCFPVHR